MDKKGILIIVVLILIMGGYLAVHTNLLHGIREGFGESCPSECFTCKTGGGADGALGPQPGTCSKFCSAWGYCGMTAAYQPQTVFNGKRGIDCRGCSGQGCTARWAACEYTEDCCPGLQCREGDKRCLTEGDYNYANSVDHTPPTAARAVVLHKTAPAGGWQWWNINNEEDCAAAGGSGYAECAANGTKYCCGVCNGGATCSSNSGLEWCACINPGAPSSGEKAGNPYATTSTMPCPPEYPHLAMYGPQGEYYCYQNSDGSSGGGSGGGSLCNCDCQNCGYNSSFPNCTELGDQYRCRTCNFLQELGPIHGNDMGCGCAAVPGDGPNKGRPYCDLGGWYGKVTQGKRWEAGMSGCSAGCVKSTLNGSDICLSSPCNIDEGLAYLANGPSPTCVAATPTYINTIETAAINNPKCIAFGQQSNGCWHLLQWASSATGANKKTKSMYPKYFKVIRPPTAAQCQSA